MIIDSTDDFYGIFTQEEEGEISYKNIDKILNDIHEFINEQLFDNLVVSKPKDLSIIFGLSRCMVVTHRILWTVDNRCILFIEFPYSLYEEINHDKLEFTRKTCKMLNKVKDEFDTYVNRLIEMDVIEYKPHKIQICGIDRKYVLKALYDAAKPNTKIISIATAEQILESTLPGVGVKEIHGKKIYVDVLSNKFDPTLYDSYNGYYLARTVIRKLYDTIRNINE